MANELSNPVFKDADKARVWLEAHLWPKGPICPQCGTVGNATVIATRQGWHQCNEAKCRSQFTVTVGTLFERSHIPLNKWLMVAFLLCASKKGVSAHQLHRMIGVSYKSTWFMMHRLREAMREGKFPSPLGGQGKVVEADETYFGKQESFTPSKQRKGRPYITKGMGGAAGKRAVVALVERNGQVHTFHPAVADGPTVTAIVAKNIARESRLMTDESRLYIKIGQQFASHETVKHSHDEYVRGDVHTNTVEGYFSIFKRGMRGIYQHCKEKHLHRYLAEYDFRYNTRAALGFNDKDRTAKMLKGIVGKRLTYRRIDQADHA